MNLMQAAVKTARQYVGQKEIKGNNGFENPVFDRYMRMVGFENGWAWCALFAELCWLQEPYENKAFLMPIITDCFSANAVKSYENFAVDKSGFFKTSLTPSMGALVVWASMTNGQPNKSGIWTRGHAGIVSNVYPDRFKSIEGNTNSQGGREGIEVAEKTRYVNYLDQNGLVVKGFVSLR